MPRSDDPITPAAEPLPRSESEFVADVGDGDGFRGEYELELERWFRRRFGWLCVAFLVWAVLSAGAVTLSALSSSDPFVGYDAGPRSWWAGLLTAVAPVTYLAIVAWFFRRVRPRIETRDEAVRAASRMILTLGAVNFAFEVAVLVGWPGAPIFPLFSIAFWHVMASLFLPWTPRESVRPMLPLLGAWLLWHLIRGLATGVFWSALGLSVLAPFVLAPGVLIAWYRLRRHRHRFRREFSRRFFVSMRRELAQARRIHESLFPQPSDDGVFRFEYRYRPAHEIGGDFVHLWTDHLGVAHAAILDVTGHGLASAMTVHRIYGELERLRYEHPYLRPGHILSLLNRYVLLTLAPHKIFATAALLRIDPREGSLTYASAGHPPIFRRSRNGQVRDLDSTHPMLGALQPQEFGVEDSEVPLEPGDTFVAYTDGAFEARNRKGHKMGIGRLREALRRQPPPPSWPEFLMQLVGGFSGGAIDDDILVATLTFLGPPTATRSIEAPSVASPIGASASEAVGA